MGHVEVDEQPYLETTEFQIGQYLCKMQREQFLHCFEFENDAVFDDEIDSVSGVQLNAVIDDRKPHLMCERDTVLRELIAETCVVSAFKAAGTEFAVDFESGTENLFRNRSVQSQINYLCVLRVLCGGEFSVQMMVR
jgi:hypothetical protein